MIQFCCPACHVPLTVKESVAGGQVNCPKCQKLILIPNSQPFVGEEDPFHADAVHPGGAVARAVGVCVEPYRKELEAKTELLNDAVEMVKARNVRIREVESLLLKVQKDLWALEVGYEAEKEDYLRSHAERKRLKQQIEQLELPKQDDPILEKRFDSALNSLSEAHQQLLEMCDRSDSFEEALETLSNLENRLDLELKRIGEGGVIVKEMGQVLRDALELLKKSAARIEELEASRANLLKQNESLDARRMELKALLRDAIDQIETVR